MTVGMWKFVQRMTHKPLKAIVTGPYTLMDWSFNEYYDTREAAVQDLTKIIRKEVVALAESGAKIIQIDEPAISTRPEEFSLAADAIFEVTKGLKCYFVLHICYGDFARLWNSMRRLAVDNLSLETTNSNFALLPLVRKYPTEKDLSLGVIDSHSHLIDTSRRVRERIQLLLKTVPRQQLWLSPDCGLKTRTTDETLEKLHALVQGAKKYRQLNGIRRF
jgi:5-methyltetrahydropteroyltriglutamate--homocysteine methyltransferase